MLTLRRDMIAKQGASGVGHLALYKVPKDFMEYHQH